MKEEPIKPNFLVIGAMKSATTTLCDVLRRHPQIFVSDPKEPDFFSSDEVFNRGLEWYESLFKGAKGKIAVGEGSTCYTKKLVFPLATQRISHYLPSAKLIYIVRDPLERLESHWLHLVANGLRRTSFEESVTRFPHMVDTSLYWDQINRYRNYYPDERILVLFFEEFIKDQAMIVKTCQSFLGVDFSPVSKSQQAANVSRSFRLESNAVTLLKKIPGARRIKAILPRFSEHIAEKLRTPHPGRPVWRPEFRRQIVDKISEDAAQFLRFYKKSADFWNIT